MEYLILSSHQSGVMPANLITLPHLSVSSDMNFPKAADVIGLGSAPKANSRASIIESARTALISLLSLSMIAAGVSLGAPSPYQPIASYPGTNSPTVGMFGRASERVALVTARARRVPAWMYPVDDGIGANATCTCPLSKSGQ